jgi:hypothetical protein
LNCFIEVRSELMPKLLRTTLHELSAPFMFLHVQHGLQQLQQLPNCLGLLKQCGTAAEEG